MSDSSVNKITDYISGQNIQATPEEIDAVQPFSRQLVEDYGYPKEHIQTRPQYRVKHAPSDSTQSKMYPVDIAVFNSDVHTDEHLKLIIECKKKTRKDGRGQLENYMTLSSAELGVWTNGVERLFLRKHVTKSGITFEEIPNIPKYGQRIEDIGLFVRQDLRPTHNLKSVFKSIRNYLAANAVGITRDETLAQQIINIIFCKIYDERFTKPQDAVQFRVGVDEPYEDVAERIRKRFREVIKRYDDVFSKTDQIVLDDESLCYVVGELQQFALTECERDIVADAFETFIGPSLKGAQGQFFTPRNVTRLIRELVCIDKDDRVIDPACGSGGFLIEALRGIWEQIDQEADEYGWPVNERDADKQKAAIVNIRGIDKDQFLSKVAKAYMAIMGDGRGGVFCENSLADPNEWDVKTQQSIKLGTFTVVMTNPPFGKNMKIADEALLDHYHLGHVWKIDKSGDNRYLEDTSKRQKGVPPQILFIERCLELLKENGRCGIVLPESVLCNPTHRYILQFLEEHATIEAVISFHEDLFQPYTHAKAAVVLFSKTHESTCESIFMAIARWCGHDSRGSEIPYDDVPDIIKRWKKFKKGEQLDFDHRGFILPRAQIENGIYLPKYYNPEIAETLGQMSKTHQLVTMGELEEKDIIAVSTGDEVGKLSYGTGNIPFIRTSDIANWQIKPDPKHGLSEEIYQSLSKKQNIAEGDILMVRDGTYLVGTCALITEEDTKIVFQSHILRFKVKENAQGIDPYLLIALLSAPIVKQQISARRFTQDIIDTLGGRWRDIVLPIPKELEARKKVSDSVKKSMDLRTQALLQSRKAVQMIEPEEEGSSLFSVINM